MTIPLSKHFGKVLFPHLCRARRRQLVGRIIAILMASVLVTASLVAWMLHAVKHAKPSDVNLTVNM